MSDTLTPTAVTAVPAAVKPAPAKVAAVVKPAAKQLPKPAAKAAAKPTAPKAPKAEVSPSPTSPMTQVVDAGGLINQKAVHQMQQDAAGIPPAAETLKGTPVMETTSTTAYVVGEAPKNVFEPINKFNHVFVNAMFTLNLGDDRLFETKSSLSSVKINGDTLNLYSPFRKAGKKKADETADAPSEGVLRHSLEALLDITDGVNNSKIVFVGKSSDAQTALSGAIESTRASIEALFPVTPDHVLFDILEEEEDAGEPPQVASQIKFGDVIAVRSWVNTPVANSEAEDVHNAVVNFVVNAGAFYDSSERVKYLKQIETVLTLISKTREDSSTNLLLAVNMSSNQLSDPSIRDLLNQLLSEEDYILYTREELHECNVSDWLPQSTETVDTALLSGKSDLLLVKLLNADDSEEGEAAA